MRVFVDLSERDDRLQNLSFILDVIEGDSEVLNLLSELAGVLFEASGPGGVLLQLSKSGCLQLLAQPDLLQPSAANRYALVQFELPFMQALLLLPHPQQPSFLPLPHLLHPQHRRLDVFVYLLEAAEEVHLALHQFVVVVCYLKVNVCLELAQTLQDAVWFSQPALE